MLFALGLGDSVVGVTHECDFPAGVATKPHLTRTVIPPGLSAAEIDAEVKRVTAAGRALYELDADRLAELEPDLIVTQAVCEVCAVSYDDVVVVAARLPGRPAVVSLDPSTLAEVLADCERLAEAAGVAAAGDALNCRLKARIEAVREALGGAEPRRTLALEWLDPPFLGGHWVPEMIAAAGGIDVAGEAGAKSPQVAWEDLTGRRPEVIVAMPCGYYVDDARAQAEAHLGALRALEPDRLFAVDAASSFSRPGPRLVDGIELLAHLLHPGLAEAPAGIGFAEIDLA